MKLPPIPLGPHRIDPPLLLAPMAGVTDRPFRSLCRRLGAGLAVSEMITSQTHLWHSRKTRSRMDHRGEPGPIAVQIAGTEPAQMAEAAREAVARGAEIVDINMGCPAKKVCNRAAGSALMRDEALVGRILETVVAAVEVPVTLKMRTGWDPAQRNAPRIAAIAEQAGIQMLTVHGRTRADGYRGEAEYDTLAEVVAATRLPVIANGDIGGADKALAVLRHTGAAGVMVGRAAHGQPWIFRELAAALRGLPLPPPLSASERRALVLGHIGDLHAFHGPVQGVRIARKHIGWYLSRLGVGTGHWRRALMRIDSPRDQLAELDHALQALLSTEEQVA